MRLERHSADMCLDHVPSADVAGACCGLQKPPKRLKRRRKKEAQSEKRDKPRGDDISRKRRSQDSLEELIEQLTDQANTLLRMAGEERSFAFCNEFAADLFKKRASAFIRRAKELIDKAERLSRQLECSEHKPPEETGTQRRKKRPKPDTTPKPTGVAAAERDRKKPTQAAGEGVSFVGAQTTPAPDLQTDLAVDGSAIDDAAERANALYDEVRKLALRFETRTSGAKLGRDKAKTVTG